MKLLGLSNVSDPNLRKILEQVQSFFSSLERDYGLVPVTSAQATNKQDRIAAPPLPSFASVVGLDGKLSIRLNDLSADVSTSGLILYEIQTSTTPEFSSSYDVTKYGPDARLAWEIQNPGVSLYLQVRARFTNSKFTKSVPFGPAVYTGLVRSSSLSSALTPVASDSSAAILLQDGANATILVNSSSLVVPSEDPNTKVVVSYSAGTIVNLDFDTYYVYADDPTRAGGVVTYKATKTYSDVIAYDGRIYFGSITLSKAGGNVGIGAASGVVAGSVATKRDGSTINVENLRAGDQLYGVGGSIETLVRDPELIGTIPAVFISTTLGSFLNAGPTTLYLQGDGGLRPFATAVLGGSITVYDPTQLPTIVGVSDTISDVERLGSFSLYKLYLDNQKFCYINGILVYFGAAAPNPTDPSSFVPAQS